jgi:hypothetical protein
MNFWAVIMSPKCKLRIAGVMDLQPPPRLLSIYLPRLTTDLIGLGRVEQSGVQSGTRDHESGVLWLLHGGTTISRDQTEYESSEQIKWNTHLQVMYSVISIPVTVKHRWIISGQQTWPRLLIPVICVSCWDVECPRVRRENAGYFRRPTSWKSVYTREPVGQQVASTVMNKLNL